MVKKQVKGKRYACLQQVEVDDFMRGDWVMPFKSAQSDSDTCTPPSSLSVAVGNGGGM